MKNKIGVYICHCGGNISDYVDVEKVRQAVEHDEGVALAKTTMFACSDANQKQMEQDIHEQGLDGVIVASCSPKLHLVTFRSVTQRGGLNKFEYVHANIREQDSWAHSDNKQGATEKAIHLVKAAIAKVRNAKALEPIKVDSSKSVAVIGAGVAGMKAALSLARMGTKVFLIEQDHFVGGRTAQWDELFTSGEKGPELVKALYDQIREHPSITLYTGARLWESSGSIGNFTLTIELAPAFIDENADNNEIKKAIEVCPVSVPDPFNFGLTSRKAIYFNHPGQFPEKVAIDKQACNCCGKCAEVCSAIHLKKEPQMIKLQAGAVVFANGFDPYTPKAGEYGFGIAGNVITLPAFKRLVSLSEKELIYNGKPVRKIAYIYCVGSRQPEGENKYCSRYCCTAAIHAASTAREKFPGILNFHFTRGVRTYGKQEIIYAEALRNGDVFLQSADDELPQVDTSNGKTIVRINDILTEQKTIELEPDLIVLVTSMVMRDHLHTETLFKIPRGRDNFLKEIHPKLRPVETVIDGITIAGTCQGPMNITESVNSALSAATKAFSYVRKGEIEIEPVIAEINKDQCTWCNKCAEACPFDAIRKVDAEGKSIAVINNSVCKGCGMCLPVCPTDAIELVTYSNKEIEDMIDMLAAD